MNNALVYSIVAIVVILVFVGALIAVSTLAPTVYDVSLSLAANGTHSLYPYMSTTFNITVSNNGGKEIVGLPVAFYLNGAEKNYSTYAIPAHQSIKIIENYTYTQPGGYLFTAAVDPGNVLDIANRTATRQSKAETVSIPQSADVYESVPNANITYTDSFTTSGTGLFTGSLMGGLYSISSLTGINGYAKQSALLGKVLEDIYPYISVANGAYSTYANGSASYSIWLQGTVTPQQIGYIVSSFSKTVTPESKGSTLVEYAALGNSTSLCSYYQGGWTKIVEYYNDSKGASCLSLTSANYTPTESNVIGSALKGTRLGSTLTANQINTTNQISWSHFYYNNATVLGQEVEYQPNSIGSSTLFQLASPQGIFLSSIKSTNTNVLAVNSTCLGLVSDINGTGICSIALPTTGTLGNQTYGAVHTKFISSTYTVDVYSLIGEAYLTLAHANAAELISKLGINSTSVMWHSPFLSSCGFDSGFGCKFNGLEQNGFANLTITNLNYSSVKLENITCGEAAGFQAIPLNGTLSQGQSITLQTVCHTVPVPVFAAETNFQLSLGFTYRNTPMIVNGTLNVSNSG